MSERGTVRFKVIRREESEYTLVVHLAPAEQDGCVVPLGHFQVEFRKWKFVGQSEGATGDQKIADERYPLTGYELGAIVLMSPAPELAR